VPRSSVKIAYIATTNTSKQQIETAIALADRRRFKINANMAKIASQKAVAAATLYWLMLANCK